MYKQEYTLGINNNAAGTNSLLSHPQHHTDVYRQTKMLNLITLDILGVHSTANKRENHKLVHTMTYLKQIFDRLDLAIEGGFVKAIPVSSRELAVDVETVFD